MKRMIEHATQLEQLAEYVKQEGNTTEIGGSAEVDGSLTINRNLTINGKVIDNYVLDEDITLDADSPYWSQDEHAFIIRDLQGNHLINVSLTGQAQPLHFYWNDYKIIVFSHAFPQDQVNSMEAGFGYAEAHLEVTINDGDSFSYCEKGPIVYLANGYDEV